MGPWEGKKRGHVTPSAQSFCRAVALGIGGGPGGGQTLTHNPTA